MKLLILSDTHRSLGFACEAIEKEAPDAVIHLGDHMGDAEDLSFAYQDQDFYYVPGNCDCRPEEPAEKLLFLGDCRVLICHGHTYGVKTSLLAAGLKAEQDQLDAFLFGHTHKPLIDRRGKTLFLNPGSVGKGLRPTYAVLTAEGGKLDGRTVFLD